MTQEQILQLSALKHIKIYLLSKAGVKNSAIAALLGTNPGHVYNVLKEYAGNPDKAARALQIADGHPLNGKPMPHPETEDNQLI